MRTAESLIIAIIAIALLILYIKFLTRIWKMTAEVHDIKILLKKILDKEKNDN